MHVQNQAAWPTGNRAKFSHGPRDNRDAGFNFDPQVIAVARRCFCIASIVSTTYVGTSWLSLLKFLQFYPDASRQDINRATPYQPCFATRLGGVSGGKVTQEWRVSSHTAIFGAGKLGSAKLPIATVTYPGKPSFSQKTVEPQVGQKWKVIALPLSAVRIHCVDLPAKVTWSRRKRA